MVEADQGQSKESLEEWVDKLVNHAEHPSESEVSDAEFDEIFYAARTLAEWLGLTVVADAIRNRNFKEAQRRLQNHDAPRK